MTYQRLDCIYHTFSIPKLFPFKFSSFSLKLFCSYLPDQTQRIKTNKNFQDRTNSNYAVPQGSVLGAVLFNIVILISFENTKVVMFWDSLMTRHRTNMQQTYQV